MDKFNIKINYVKDNLQLVEVLNICYTILGDKYRVKKPYRYEDWLLVLNNGYSNLLLYATYNKEIIAAVLGRVESTENIICGFVACKKKYRLKGITKTLMKKFEQNCVELGFQKIILGSLEDTFYLRCGYEIVNNIYGQNIFQKIL